MLTIERFRDGPPDDEVMIRFLDKVGNEFTHHHSYDIEQAFADAEFEFGIMPSEWVDETKRPSKT
jgi:hypothetical protein